MALKPHLLYLSPVVPAPTGNGLAMRAAMNLQALAQRYTISLLVVPLYAPGGPISERIASLCQQVTTLSGNDPPPLALRGRLLAWLRRRRLSGSLRGSPFEIVHVFRLATLPFARMYLDDPSRPRRHLDLDDIESTTRRHLAALYRSHGDYERATAEEAEAKRCEMLEHEVLETFDRVYVCSERDRDALRAGSAVDVCVLPNGLPVPDPLPPKPAGQPFTFLFVGTVGYYPNEDAILHFCADMLPLIRPAAPREFRVHVVGTGAGGVARRLADIPEVRVVGAVPDVRPWYRDADAVIVPIRAGGGTRIKVLEAFSYRRPVVSTPTGIEGIDAHPEEHVLVGDTPDRFAAHCLRLMTDAQLTGPLTERAFSLFMGAYSTEAIARIVARLS